MNDSPVEVFEELIEQWVCEFSRAIEMFTGEKPVLNVVGSLPAEELEPEIKARTWWKQVVKGEGSFCIWTGTVESVWTALGEGAESQATFFEMLSQANQGATTVLSAKFPVPLRCGDGLIEAPVLPVKLESVQIKVEFKGTDAGTVLLLIESAAGAILRPEEAPTAALTAIPQVNAVDLAGSPMLSRLMDLQLPVSVLLGRANITIREALKLMTGSVVELDRQVGDQVEVMVHGIVVATGEIVSVKGNYGVRIKEVISRQDRMALHKAA